MVEIWIPVMGAMAVIAGTNVGVILFKQVFRSV